VGNHPDPLRVSGPDCGVVAGRIPRVRSCCRLWGSKSATTQQPISRGRNDATIDSRPASRARAAGCAYSETVIRTILLILNVIALGFALFAFIDVLRTRADAFPAVERQTKVVWLIFIGLSVLVIPFGVVNFLGIIGVIVTMFYFVDVRPKVREITGSR